MMVALSLLTMLLTILYVFQTRMSAWTERRAERTLNASTPLARSCVCVTTGTREMATTALGSVPVGIYYRCHKDTIHVNI